MTGGAAAVGAVARRATGGLSCLAAARSARFAQLAMLSPIPQAKSHVAPRRARPCARPHLRRLCGPLAPTRAS